MHGNTNFMNKANHFFRNALIIASISITTFSCNQDKPLGPITEKTETYNDIHTVIINVPGSVSIIPDTAFSVTVQAHEEIVDAITLTNTLGQLTVSIPVPEEGLKYDIFNVTVRSKMVREVTNNLSSDVTVGDVMNYTSAKINQNGTGTIIVNHITSNLTEVNLSGTGTLTLGGTTENANLKLIGTGNIKSFDLVGENVIANISGSGNIETTASSTLGAIISGTGSIYYKGNPTIDVSITGTGTIKDAN